MTDETPPERSIEELWTAIRAAAADARARLTPDERNALDAALDLMLFGSCYLDARTGEHIPYATVTVEREQSGGYRLLRHASAGTGRPIRELAYDCVRQVAWEMGTARVFGDQAFQPTGLRGVLGRFRDDVPPPPETRASRFNTGWGESP